MFAVIKTGGKQYKVAEGDTIVVEKLNAEAGKDVVFDTVLMLGEGANVTVGAPVVAGAAVTGEVAEQTRGDKVITRKKRQLVANTSIFSLRALCWRTYISEFSLQLRFWPHPLQY
ncbi:MAG: 50S ribosomal protein L21 [Hyphomonas sp.]